MCLITEQQKPLIADKDIICYKIVMLEYNPKGVLSQVHKFLYNLGELYKTEIKDTTDPRFPSFRAAIFFGHKYYESLLDDVRYNRYIPYKLRFIGEGFHAFTELKHAENENVDDIIVECIIPEGSQYYVDELGFIVSNQIIIKEIV